MNYPKNQGGFNAVVVVFVLVAGLLIFGDQITDLLFARFGNAQDTLLAFMGLFLLVLMVGRITAGRQKTSIWPIVGILVGLIAAIYLK